MSVKVLEVLVSGEIEVVLAVLVMVPDELL